LQVPFTLWDISLWLAVTSITLLITAELVSPYYGQTSLLINIKRLKNVALTMGILFLAVVTIEIIGIIFS
jgi:hypothetical protein